MKNILDFIKEYQAIITIIISSVVSYYVAKAKAKSEIDKLMLTWSHDDKTNFTKAFQQLIIATSSYCRHQICYELDDAMSANATLMSLSPKEFQPLISNLDIALNNRDIEQIQCVRQKLMSLYFEWINQSK